jgi:hypothetical protein
MAKAAERQRDEKLTGEELRIALWSLLSTGAVAQLGDHTLLLPRQEGSPVYLISPEARREPL